ncbi:MAG: glycosyltransferase [Bacteroidales bacterium]|nr:glycosyltransferase [Bacteroidales bacterium]
MIKVLRIINRFNLGGPVNNALYLSKYLDEKYETLLVGGIHTEDEMSASFMFEQEGVPITIIEEMSRSINLFDDIKAFVKLYRIAKKFNPDIIHTHASKAGFMGRVVGILLRTPVKIHTFHGHVFDGYFGKLKTKVFITIEQILAKSNDAIIAISPKQKEDLTRKYKIAPEHKFKIIALGFDLSRFEKITPKNRADFRKERMIDDDVFCIAIIGRLASIKNHELFIRSFAKLKQISDEKIVALIVGDGERREALEALSHELDLTFSSDPSKADIQFTSWVKDTEKVYAAADLVALTSINEGTPVTLIEAQAALKPIITTDAGGTVDILQSSPLIKVCDNQPDHFANEMLALIEAIKNTGMSEKVRQNTMAQFHYRSLVDNMDQLYQSLLNA